MDDIDDAAQQGRRSTCEPHAEGGAKLRVVAVREPAPSILTLFENERAYVRRTLRRFGVPLADVDDVMHDVFLAVHAHLDEYEPTRPIRPWLCAFAWRVAAKYKHCVRRFGRVNVAAELDSVDPSPLADEQFASSEAHDRVRLALELVAESRRAILVQHDIHGVPVPDIAAALSISLNTAYSRLRLARAELRAAMQKLAPASG